MKKFIFGLTIFFLASFVGLYLILGYIKKDERDLSTKEINSRDTEGNLKTHIKELTAEEEIKLRNSREGKILFPFLDNREPTVSYKQRHKLFQEWGDSALPNLKKIALMVKKQESAYHVHFVFLSIGTLEAYRVYLEVLYERCLIPQNKQSEESLEALNLFRSNREEFFTKVKEQFFKAKDSDRKEFIQLALKGIQLEDPTFRLGFLYLLGEFKARETTTQVIDYFNKYEKNLDKHYQVLAPTVLGLIGGAKAEQFLIELLHSDLKVAKSAISPLGDLGTKKALAEFIKRVASTSDNWEQGRWLNAFSGSVDNSCEDVLIKIASQEGGSQHSAIGLLGQLTTQSSEDFIIKWGIQQFKEDPDEYSTFLRVLRERKINNPRVISFLKTILDAPNFKFDEDKFAEHSKGWTAERKESVTAKLKQNAINRSIRRRITVLGVLGDTGTPEAINMALQGFVSSEIFGPKNIKYLFNWPFVRTDIDLLSKLTTAQIKNKTLPPEIGAVILIKSNPESETISKAYKEALIYALSFKKGISEHFDYSGHFSQKRFKLIISDADIALSLATNSKGAPAKKIMSFRRAIRESDYPKNIKDQIEEELSKLK